MFRLVKISALALLLSVLGIVHASAETITDPIVRTKAGGGSIGIPPLNFSFGAFASDPDGDSDSCNVGTDEETSLTLVSCAFQNLTGQTITSLNFDFDYGSGEPPPIEEFSAVDEGGFFDFQNINQFSAVFGGGGGIPPAVCEGELCIPFGGEFIVELVGFPTGTVIDMVVNETEVPEPMTLTLLATGLALGASARRRTKKEGRRTKG